MFGRRNRALPEFLNVPWSVRDLLLFVVAWFGLQVVTLLALKALGPVVPPVNAFLHGAAAGDIMASFLLNVLDAALGLGVVAWILRRYHVGWSALGWRRVSLRQTALYLAAILVIFMVVVNVALIMVSVLVPHFDPNQAQQNEFTHAGGHNNLALIALVLLPPVLEETIFRGFVFPAIAKRAGLIWGAVLSSVIFGIAHWQANISIYTFVLGLLLCFMYVRLRSIVPGILLHMVNNYLAFIALGGK